VTTSSPARLFGLPSSLTCADAEALVRYLSDLWEVSYHNKPGELSVDLERCRDYFDPLLRGQTIRQRLQAVGTTLPPPHFRFGELDEPVLFELGQQRRIVGVEARLLLDVWSSVRETTERCELSDAVVEYCLDRASSCYRSWALQRFRQVSSLQQGKGPETLQAKSIGLVLAMLVNRSTEQARAVRVGKEVRATPVERALFAAAEAFAEVVAERSERSMGEDRFKGGYALTEARRRISALRIDRVDDERRYYVVPETETAVIEQLAFELARRPRTRIARVSHGYDALLVAYRQQAAESAWLGGFFERPAESETIKRQLLASFTSKASGDRT